MISPAGFAGSLLRQILFAVYKTAEEDDPRPGLDYLKQEVPHYWDRRQTITALLKYLSQKPSAAMAHWKKDVEAAISCWEPWKETAYDPSLRLPPQSVEGFWYMNVFASS